MKTRFSLFGIFAVMLIAISTCFIGCQNDVNDVVTYRGEVVYINTTTPFADVTVKVTDGKNTHCQTLTDGAGLFSLKVRVNEIDGNYYLLAGDSTCIPKKVALGGYGQAEVDLGTIEVEGPALPTVVTKTIQSVTADAAIIGGDVQTDGRLSVTARGICYGMETYPTVDGLRTTDGTGKGEFTSNLKNLQHNTIYYARAYATNRMGTAYGEQVKFTTEEGVAIVVTDSIIRITAHSARCKGHVESDGGYPVTKRGTCWSKQPDPTIDDFCTNDGSGLGEFTSAMNDLIENTTYYVRTYATNSTSTTYGEQFIITTLDGLAVVTTDSIASITATGFSAYGTVVSDCDIPVTARGFCYATTQEPTIEGKHTTIGKGLGSFYSAISGLEYATTYYIRAYATNATETVYGKQFEITTLSGLPTVTTDSVSNIGSVKATCGGNVTDDGTLTVIARGVCYGIEQQPTINDAHTSDGRGKGQFTSNLKNLQDKTTYYVRAYATTDAGTAYGEQRVFRTEDGLPVVVLSQLDTPTANSITCEGNVTEDGGVTVTERGFCYSTSQYPTNTGTHIAIGNGIGVFSGSLTNLSINTTYYIRAYAVNSIGVGYSAQQSFTTLDGMPVVTTGQPTATATTINVGGEVTDNGGYTVTERGVCYSATNSEPTTADDKVTSGRGNGAYSVSIVGLSAVTNYYLRAYAVNENGTAYGETRTIVTSNGSATVTAGAITNITALTATGSVTVVDAGGATLQSCGLCWSTTPNPTIENNTAIGGNQINTAYTCNMFGLTPNTTYYVRAYATTDITTSYSSQITFQTSTGLPIITTTQPTATATSITVGGNITSDGGYNVTERGICYSSTNSTPSLTDNYISSGRGNGTFSKTITSLSVNTTYYIRAYATNSIGTAYGQTITVSTKNGCAIVTVGTISDIMALSATGSVTITDDGGATLQACGICWSETPNPTILNNKSIANGNQLNTIYDCSLSSLQPNTTYYVRAYATTDVTTSYSSQTSFRTTTGLPVLTTTQPTATATSITVGGDITSNGGYNVTERGICYSSTNSTPTLTDTHISCGSGNGTFSKTLSSLPVNTTYYICAYATNSIGTEYGQVVSIKTKDGKASVTTGSITNITTTSAIGSLTITNVGGSTLQSSGICWSSTHNPTTQNSKVTGGNQLNTEYTCNLTGLNSNTTYYVRAYATTAITTTYGDEVSFTTLANVSGVVKNASGQYISNATITFKKGSTAIKSVTSNTNGGFSLQLAAGAYNVEASATGYVKYSGSFNIDSSPIEIVMQQLGILSGIVYDDDNIPLANATVKVKSSNNTTLSAISNSDGTYRIENIALGQTSSITCTLSGYQLTATIPNMNINSGNNNLNIHMSINTPVSCSTAGFLYECMSEGMCGTTVTRTFQITNNRQKSVSWSLLGIPSKGITFSPSNGTIPAKSSVTVTATFTYPGPSVSGSVRTTLYNCIINNQYWTYTFLWNWSNSGMLNSDCNTWCSQNITILAGNNTLNFEAKLYQLVVWRD